MSDYFRPIAKTDECKPDDAYDLAGGWCWFSHVEWLTRKGTRGLVSAGDLPRDILDRLTAPRSPVAGIGLKAPRLMGILNVTPDSFSDGGQFWERSDALAQANAMAQSGADILDIGGESTRPGADVVEIDEEIGRTAPIIETIAQGSDIPISIDTRKADVARAAHKAGATIMNDVSAMSFDPGMATVAREANAPICLMHAQGDPKTMQDKPSYDNVLLDVYDYLAARVEKALDAGVARANIIVDPGIGFGKTADHNLALIRGLSLFHGLGCPVLLGASRKRFIGTIGDARDAANRAPGSIAVALAGLGQGVQITRVHDISETKQAFKLWQALHCVA